MCFLPLRLCTVDRKIPDHAPVMLCISERSKSAGIKCSLPKLWVTGPIYESRIAFLIDRIKPLTLPPLEQLPAIKECIRSAAFFTRDSLNFADAGGRESRRLTLESLARAVWHNDSKLARKLLDTTVLAKQHTDIISGKIVVLDPPLFKEAYRIEREYYHLN